MEASLLNNYLFCYHDSFKEKLSAERLKYCRGLIQVLDGWIYNQNNLLQFIKLCKESADKKGFLTQKFFNILDIKRAKFISGPFTDMLFYIISKTKKNLKISIENKIAIIDRNAGYLYHSIWLILKKFRLKLNYIMCTKLNIDFSKCGAMAKLNIFQKLFF